MSKRNIGIVAIVLLLIFGTGTFVFANSSENLENVPKTGGSDQSVKQIDSSNKKQETDKNASVSSNDQSVSTPIDVIENNEEPKKTINNSTVNNKDYGSGTKAPSLNDTINEDNKQEDVGENNENNSSEVPENPDNSNTGGNEENKEPDNDNSYAIALEAVIKAEQTLNQNDIDSAASLIQNVLDINKKSELQNRLNIVQNIVDVTLLVKQLEQMVNEAKCLDDIQSARDFRNNEQIVEKVNNLPENNKQNLLETLTTLSKILNDTSVPSINGLPNEIIVNHIEATKEGENKLLISFGENKIMVSDENSLTILLDGTETNVEDINNSIQDGVHTIIFRDSAYNEIEITFTIDTEKPIIKGIENNKIYKLGDIVKIVVEDDNVGTIHLENDGKVISEYNAGDLITEDGEYTVYAVDKAGNISETFTFTVDMTLPTAKISYSKTELTNEDVIATLVDASEEIKVINNEGKDTYTFTKNGVFTFEIEDLAGNRTTVTANVTWIDKTAPTASISYSITELTNKDVVVSLINASEEIKVINNEGKDTYTFTKNGEFTFEIEDLAGNKGTVTANVTWIDKTSPTAFILYSTTNLTNSDVVVSLVNASEEIRVINNEGKDTYTFTENGEFTFEIEDLAGNKGTVTANVTWIDKTAPAYTGLGILNFSNLNTTESLEIAKDGDEVLVFVTFIEKLAVLPTITINNIEVNTELDINYSNDGLFVYTAKYTIDENNIEAGEVQFKVSNYADDAGNIGNPLTNTDIKTNEYAKVVVEIEKGFEFIDEGSFSNGVIIIKNPEYAYLEIIDWNSDPSKPIICRSTTCKLTKNGLYTFTLYGKNKKPLGDSVTMVFDSISPIITAIGLNGSEKEKVIPGVEYTSVTLTIEDDLDSIKKVFNNHTEEIQNNCKYDENRRCVLTFTQGGDYKVIATDKAGNTSTVEFMVKQTQKQTLASAVLSLF